jgi:flagellar motility protein MotE (MotC chaperone)
MKPIFKAMAMVAVLATVSAGAMASVRVDGTGDVRSRSEHLQSLADMLAAKERELDRRGQQMQSREKDIRVAEAEIETQIEALEQLKSDLDGRMVELDEEEESRRAGLTKMVESVRARNAAPMFGEFSDDVALDVLGRMNREKAGKLLAELEPKRAATLAEGIATGVLQ